MSLSNIYLNQVKHNPVNMFSSSFGGMPTIEKDPTILGLEQQLFDKFQEINPPEEIKSPIKIKPNTVEDAIRELLELQKNNSFQ